VSKNPKNQRPLLHGPRPGDAEHVPHLHCPHPMAMLTPSQRVWRARIESVLRIAAPALDLYLAAGDRLARAVERDDLDWVPPRTALAPSETPRT
jgi:hypothetical protein